MKIYAKNPIAIAIINGETQSVEIDELPEHVTITPCYALVKAGVDLARRGPHTMDVINNCAVIRTLAAGFELGEAYLQNEYEEATARKKRAA